MSDKEATSTTGMSARKAGVIEYTIIAFCIAALAMIFQPFLLALFTIGSALVVFGALAFNLVPLAVPGAPVRAVVTGGVVVSILFFVIVGLAILSAWLYGVYFVKPIG